MVCNTNEGSMNWKGGEGGGIHCFVGTTQFWQIILIWKQQILRSDRLARVSEGGERDMVKVEEVGEVEEEGGHQADGPPTSVRKEGGGGNGKRRKKEKIDSSAEEAEWNQITSPRPPVRCPAQLWEQQQLLCCVFQLQTAGCY